ncbi:MAG TPA: ATP-binding protein, partial [Cytophagaceae bacterium]
MSEVKLKSSTSTKIILGFGLAIIILVTAGIISYQSFQDLKRSLSYLSHPDTKLVKLNDLLSDLSLSENNIRSYFITNEKKYLDQYYQYSERLERNIDSLMDINEELKNGRHNIQKIANLWHEKKNHTQELLELYRKKSDKRLPDGILKKLNEANPDVPTIIITKTITTKNVEVPSAPEPDETDEEEEQGEKRSIFGRIFKKKDKGEVPADTVKPKMVTVEEVTTFIDTVYTMRDANALKEEAFTRILTNIRNQNAQSKKLIQENETEIIQKDIGLIEYIRNIVLELKDSEQKITQRKVAEAKAIVELSIIKLFLFGILGILTIVIVGFMVMDDVTRNNYHKLKLLHAKRQAEDLVKAKENFLATMSHEIRTPLNSIVGFTEQLSQTKLLNRQKYYLQAVSNATTHLLSLVNDILDHSRIEAGKIEFERTTFSLQEILDEVCDAFYIKAAEKYLQLSYTLPESGDLLLIGDPLRLKQILFNLVSNAIKFTESGSVSITCTTTADTEDQVVVCFKVKDTGIGISPEKTETIFQSFSQADSSISRKFGGTGLGLAISKKLVELQGGKISVNSTVGKGSEFSFYITYKRSNEKHSYTLYKEAIDYSQLSGIKILLVEDDEFNLLLFHTILIKWNIKVRMVSSGEEALQILAHEAYDLIITDIHMPGMSGVDLYKAVQARAGLSHIPFLAVTANVIKDSMNIVKDCGFKEILLKPFKEEQLAKAILKAIDKPAVSAMINEGGNVLVSNTPKDMFTDFIQFSGGNMEAVYSMVDVFISNS